MVASSTLSNNLNLHVPVGLGLPSIYMKFKLRFTCLRKKSSSIIPDGLDLATEECLNTPF